MRIIFDNGEIADLENVYSVVVDNESEAVKLQEAINLYDLEVLNGDKSGARSSNELISRQPMVASESSENAGQTSMGDL